MADSTIVKQFGTESFFSFRQIRPFFMRQFCWIRKRNKKSSDFGSSTSTANFGRNAEKRMCRWSRNRVHRCEDTNKQGGQKCCFVFLRPPLQKGLWSTPKCLLPKERFGIVKIFICLLKSEGNYAIDVFIQIFVLENTKVDREVLVGSR